MKPMSDHHRALRLTVVRTTEQTVTAKTEDGQVWQIPHQSIHGKPTEGGFIHLVALTSDAEGVAKSGLAKHLLEELLNP